MRNPDILLVWPRGQTCDAATPPPGYQLRTLTAALDEWWIDIHRLAVPAFARSDLETWLAHYRKLMLEDGVLVAVHTESGAPVATAGSLANDKQGMFPGAGQIGYVATVPEHRGRGLGRWLSTIATHRLLDDGYRTIFLCTGDDLTAAISVYRKMGYVPCMYADDQHERWQRICEAIGLPFEPECWPTVQEYLDS
jgi:ribosomal protein S18 acetylase RimI-like enzyme